MESHLKETASGIPPSKKLKSDVNIQPQSTFHKNIDKSRRHTCGDHEKLKLLMLYLHRGIKNKYKFKLALDGERTDSFYEVYIDYEENKRICLRISHKPNVGEAITYTDLNPTRRKDKTTGEFAIQNYFLSYLEAKSGALREKKVLKHFVVCTDDHFDVDHWGYLMHRTETDRLKILQIVGISRDADEYEILDRLLTISCVEWKSKFHRIKYPDNKERIIPDLLQLDEPAMSSDKRKVLSNIKTNLQNALDIEQEKINFMESLIFAQNQPNKGDLDELIRTEMGRDFIRTDNDLLPYYFQARMLEFFKQNCHDEAHEKLSVAMLTGLALECERKIRDFAVEFKKDNLNRLHVLDFIKSDQQVLQLVSQRLVFTGMKVIRILRDNANQRNTCKYISMRQSALLVLRNLAIGVFASEECFLFIIKCDSKVESENVKQLKDDLSLILLADKNKKLILLSREDDPLFQAFASDPKLREKCLRQDDNSCLDCFSLSMEKYLEQEVAFQSQSVTLEQLLGKNPQDTVDYGTLMDLIEDVQVTIGNSVTEPDMLHKSYMHRNCEQGTRIDVETLKRIMRESNDKFTIVGASSSLQNKFMFHPNESNFNHPIRFLDKEDSDERFANLCNIFANCNVHFLNCESNRLTWIKTRGSPSSLQRYTNKNTMFMTETHLREHRRVVICNMPGAGKSTMLRNYAKQLKKKFPKLWVLIIDLDNYTDVLAEEAEARNIGSPSFTPEDSKSAIVFLLERMLRSREESRLKTDLEKELFRRSFEKPGRMALLFDGYNEIRADCREVVIDLLKSLGKTNVEKIWVTTRPCLREELEGLFGEVSISLQALSQHQEIDYLTKLWEDPGRTEAYAKKLMKRLAKSANKIEEELRSSVLTLHMLAETFGKSAEGPHQPDEITPKLPEKFDLNDLYRKFFAGSKRVATLRNEESNNKTSSVENLSRHHQELAFYLLSVREGDNPWHPRTAKLSDDQKRNLPKTGIVEETGDRLKFSNSIFVDYFVADFLAQNLGELEAREIDFMLTDILLKRTYDLVRFFLNGELRRIDCKTETWRKFGERMRELWSEKKLCDANGRTLLHVACVENNTMIVKFLLNGLSAVEHPLRALREVVRATDKERYERTALHCAIESGNLEVVQLLVEHGADVNEEGAGERTPLHFAAESGYLLVVQWLLQHGADIDSVDLHNRTALFAAAEYDKWNVVRWLVLNNAALNVQTDNGTVLHCAAESGNLSAVKLLVKHGARTEIFDVHMRTALYVAAEQSEWNVVRLLVKNGAKINYVDMDEFRSALLIAAKVGNWDMVKWLIKHGAYVDADDPEEGTTVLHLAVECGNVDMVRFLAKRAAQIDFMDARGRSALQYANPTVKNYVRIRKVLKKNGALVGDSEDDGNSEDDEDSED